MFIVPIFQLMACVFVTSMVVTVGQAENNRIAYEKELCKVRCEPRKTEFHLVKYEKNKCYCVLDDGTLQEKPIPSH